MQRLQETDGSELHRKVTRAHIGKVKEVKTDLHKALLAEARKAYDNLKAAERAHEDAADNEAEERAAADAAEVDFENAIRKLDGALADFDREHPGRGARIAVFPRGFGEVIEPDGPAQLDVLPVLHARLKPWRSEADPQAAIQKLDDTEAELRKAIETEEAAIEATATAFADELRARSEVRQQLESAYGRLRDFYKANPTEAERFFLKMGRREGKPNAKPKGATGATGASGPTGPT